RAASRARRGRAEGMRGSFGTAARSPRPYPGRVCASWDRGPPASPRDGRPRTAPVKCGAGRPTGGSRSRRDVLVIQIGDASDVVEVVVGYQHRGVVGDRVRGDEDVDGAGGAHEPSTPQRRLDVEDEALVRRVL